MGEFLWVESWGVCLNVYYVCVCGGVLKRALSEFDETNDIG